MGIQDRDYWKEWYRERNGLPKNQAWSHAEWLAYKAAQRRQAIKAAWFRNLRIALSVIAWVVFFVGIARMFR